METGEMETDMQTEELDSSPEEDLKTAKEMEIEEEEWDLKQKVVELWS